MNHVGWLHGAYTSRAQPCPDLSRKHIQGRQAHLERQNRIRTKAGRRDAAIGPGHRACDGRSRLEARRHDGPCLAASLDVPLGGQQRISGLDRASCQTQFLGQRARRGNSVARLQHAAGDGAAKPIVDLAIKRFGRRWIQRRDLAGLRDGHGTPQDDKSRQTGRTDYATSLTAPRRGSCITWTSREFHSWPLDVGHDASRS